MAEKVKVKLIGEDGNIFFIMAKVSKELKRNGQESKAKEMRERIEHEAKSYYEALTIVDEYVDII